VAVANLGAKQLQPRLAKLPLQPEIGHDRRHDPTALELSASLEPQRDQGHQLIPVDDRAFFIDDHQPVGVTIECNADICTARDHRFLQ